jgi:hypothetical protein
LWCYTKGCRSVLVSKDQLETSFLTLLGALQPTVEYLNQLPAVAAKQQEVRGESIRQESRALNLTMAEQKRLNSQAIRAKLIGELSSEDFEALKQNITDETKKIEIALSALESERKNTGRRSEPAIEAGEHQPRPHVAGYCCRRKD